MRWKRATELSEDQRDDLHDLYRNEWWTEGRTRSGVDAVVEGSDAVVALCDPGTGTLVAFARVLTDYAYKALVFDVIVAPGHRGTGLGRRLMDEVLGLPELSGVEHVELYCRADVVPFYERWGFDDDLGDLRLMRLER